MGWRNCAASLSLIAEVNTRWLGRDKSSDGTIGDAAHASTGSASDHNPWVVVGGVGVVRARDIDVDGIDAGWLAERLRQLGAAGDRRLVGGGYVILNRRITNPDFRSWRVYGGSNPHTSHMHVSFTRNASGFDSGGMWGITGGTTPVPGALPTLRYGSTGAAVKALQLFLNSYGWSPPLPLLTVDGAYGPKTRATIRAAQAQMGVLGADADGSIVGPRTNAALAARGYRG